MTRKELNLIWEKKSLMVWLHTNNAILPKSWLLKRIHALGEGKAEHPLGCDSVSSASHTSVTPKICNTMYSQYTLQLWTLRQTVFLLHAQKLKPVKTVLIPRLF